MHDCSVTVTSLSQASALCVVLKSIPLEAVKNGVTKSYGRTSACCTVLQSETLPWNKKWTG